MEIKYSARSHVGRIRGNNEDNLYVDGVMLTPETRERPFSIDGITRAPAIFAVFDGIGGEDDGERASFLAAQALMEADERIKSATTEQLEDIVQSYVREVCNSISSDVSSLGKRAGTTLALAVAAHGGVYCYNSGDSRIYALQVPAFKQITNDHTLGAEHIRNGVITEAQAPGLRGGHKLTRCMGIGDITAAESYPPITGDCRLLICSDGLTDLVGEAEVKAFLQTCASAADAADLLLRAALENGGMDNATLIVADVKDPEKPFLRSLLKKMKGYRV